MEERGGSVAAVDDCGSTGLSEGGYRSAPVNELQRLASSLCLARLEHSPGDPASPMDDAKDSHAVAVATINCEIGVNDADANPLPKPRTGRPNVRMVAYEPIKGPEALAIVARDARTGFCGQILQNLGKIVIGARRNDDARHLAASFAMSASIRASCSSRVKTSPRSTCATASST